MDRTLLYGGLTLIVLLVALVIGAAMIDKTTNVSATIAPSGTLTTATSTSIANTYTTFTGVLPLAALGMVGAVALFYLFGIVRGVGGQ